MSFEKNQCSLPFFWDYQRGEGGEGMIKIRGEEDERYDNGRGGGDRREREKISYKKSRREIGREYSVIGYV